MLLLKLTFINKEEKEEIDLYKTGWGQVITPCGQVMTPAVLFTYSSVLLKFLDTKLVMSTYVHVMKIFE